MLWQIQPVPSPQSQGQKWDRHGMGTRTRCGHGYVSTHKARLRQPKARYHKVKPHQQERPQEKKNPRRKVKVFGLHHGILCAHVLKITSDAFGPAASRAKLSVPEPRSPGGGV